MELRANSAGVLDAVGPRDDERIARATEVRGDLLAPLERSVHGPGPADGNVVGGFGAAEFVDVLRQELGIFRNALKRRQFVETSVKSAFHGSAVIANLPKDERVVELA